LTDKADSAGCKKRQTLRIFKLPQIMDDVKHNEKQKEVMEMKLGITGKFPDVCLKLHPYRTT
jgi:hypothetical protein